MNEISLVNECINLIKRIGETIVKKERKEYSFHFFTSNLNNLFINL